MADRKPCKVCNFTRQKSYGLAVPSLDDLKMKGSEFLGFSSGEAVTVVLENDGTIVEDQAYFLCLPLNTKFMLLHEKETWSPVRRVDGGTAWMVRDSLVLEVDTVDNSSAAAPWLNLAQQLKQDLTSIILMSDADLQMLVVHAIIPPEQKRQTQKWQPSGNQGKAPKRCPHQCLPTLSENNNRVGFLWRSTTSASKGDAWLLQTLIQLYSPATCTTIDHNILNKWVAYTACKYSPPGSEIKSFPQLPVNIFYWPRGNDRSF
ncbi:DNA fragmentation factor subunit alpha isoform X2 [Cyclopterus lumpus]|uniref:DNA fragmentation factor subunit alpha isoform X2 n=1 Tax=Cyclopterus lumpus TaxID=8103 RepID=UPI0014874E76|nr:DNA fragmentation factor subunit alpha isoform X2 [Cyclopterus lumpus]